MAGWTGGADHARTAHHGELNRGAAYAPGGAVDEQRAAVPDAELVERARGRLDGGRQRKRYAAELTAGAGHDRFDFTIGLMIDGLARP